MTPRHGGGNLYRPDPDVPTTGTGQPTEDGNEPSSGRGRRLILTPASSIAPRRAKWLWDGRFAVGTLAILAGREGVGKSTLAYTIAAQVTTGGLPGELHGHPAAVLVAATEDSWAHTIVPRLIAAGASMDLVFRVNVNADLGEAELSLPTDVTAVGKAAEQTGAALLLLDPLLSRLSGRLDTHKDQETRQALEPLTKMLDTTAMVALGLMHFNKSGSDDPMNALMASRAFSAVARSVSVVVRDPADGTGGRRLFGTVMNNLGPDDLPSISFTLEPFSVSTVEGDTWTSRIVWGEEVADSITEVMRHSGQGNVQSATQEAADWLCDYLNDQDGLADSAAIKEAGATAGHGTDALHRARRRLGLLTTSGGFPRNTAWHLPGRPQQPSITVEAAAPGSPTTASTATSGPSHGSHGSGGSHGSPEDTTTTDTCPEPTDTCPDCKRALDNVICWECALPGIP